MVDAPFILSVLKWSIAIIASWHALLTKRDPRAALGWIAACMLSPLAGPVLYYLFGINRVARLAKGLRIESNEKKLAIPSKYEHLITLSDHLARYPLLEGNRFELLNNGDEAYPAMLSAIDSAQTSIYLETYIFQTDFIGLQFIDALERAVQRGVEVKTIIDGAGDFYSYPRASQLLESKCIPIARFLPPKLMPPSLLINLRNHRKILVIDGKTAFVGGMNISGHHLIQKSLETECAIDTQFRVTGPVVSQITEAFIDDWRFTSGEHCHNPAVSHQASGPSLARVITDGPDADMGVLTTLIISAVSAAKSNVYIMTPYFLPTLDLATALKSAALRGVDVQIILPGKNNLPFVHWASRHILAEFLRRGVSVYYQDPPFVHTKLMLIDHHYAQIGSANLDSRSLRLNFELVVEIFDTDFNAMMEQQFEQAKTRSSAVKLEDLLNRNIWTRSLDASCWLMSPYL